MLFCIIGLTFSVSTFSLIRSAHVLKNFVNTIKNVIDIVLLSSFPYISLSTPWSKNIIVYVIKKTVFILQDRFVLFKFKSIYIKYIQFLPFRPKFEPSISNNMWPHVSDPKLDHNFHVSGFILGLYYVSSHMWKFSTCFQIREGVRIHRNFIPY